jgi:hypothetical protein
LWPGRFNRPKWRGNLPAANGEPFPRSGNVYPAAVVRIGFSAQSKQRTAEAGGPQEEEIAMLSNLVYPVIVIGFVFAQDGSSMATSSAPKTARTQAASTDAVKPAEVNLIDVEKQMLEKTNAQRTHYGLPPLVVDRSLIQTARAHAAWMTNNQTLQHTSKNVGENIAMGQHTTDEAVTDWMASPGHRANILNSSYKRTGVAAYRTKDGTIYWCQQFLP